MKRAKRLSVASPTAPITETLPVRGVFQLQHPMPRTRHYTLVAHGGTAMVSVEVAEAYATDEMIERLWCLLDELDPPTQLRLVRA